MADVYCVHPSVSPVNALTEEPLYCHTCGACWIAGEQEPKVLIGRTEEVSGVLRCGCDPDREFCSKCRKKDESK
jgi:hypothetical protein